MTVVEIKKKFPNFFNPVHVRCHGDISYESYLGYFLVHQVTGTKHRNNKKSRWLAYEYIEISPANFRLEYTYATRTRKELRKVCRDTRNGYICTKCKNYNKGVENGS
jgi:hypothetical protein